MPHFTELSQFFIDPGSVRLLNRRFCEANQLVILGTVDPRDVHGQLTVGMLDTNQPQLLRRLESWLHRKVRPVRLNSYEIGKAIEESFDEVLDVMDVTPLDSDPPQTSDAVAVLDHMLA